MIINPKRLVFFLFNVMCSDIYGMRPIVPSHPFGFLFVIGSYVFQNAFIQYKDPIKIINLEGNPIQLYDQNGYDVYFVDNQDIFAKMPSFEGAPYYIPIYTTTEAYIDGKHMSIPSRGLNLFGQNEKVYFVYISNDDQDMLVYEKIKEVKKKTALALANLTFQKDRVTMAERFFYDTRENSDYVQEEILRKSREDRNKGHVIIFEEENQNDSYPNHVLDNTKDQLKQAENDLTFRYAALDQANKEYDQLLTQQGFYDYAAKSRPRFQGKLFQITGDAQNNGVKTKKGALNVFSLKNSSHGVEFDPWLSSIPFDRKNYIKDESGKMANYCSFFLGGLYAAIKTGVSEKAFLGIKAAINWVGFNIFKISKKDPLVKKRKLRIEKVMENFHDCIKNDIPVTKEQIHRAFQHMALLTHLYDDDFFAKVFFKFLSPSTENRFHLKSNIIPFAKRALDAIKIYQGQFDMNRLTTMTVDTSSLSCGDRSILAHYNTSINQSDILCLDDKLMLKNIAALTLPDMTDFSGQEKWLELKLWEKEVLNMDFMHALQKGRSRACIL